MHARCMPLFLVGEAFNQRVLDTGLQASCEGFLKQYLEYTHPSWINALLLCCDEQRLQQCRV